MYKYRGVAGASDWTGKVNADNMLRSFLYQEPPGGYKRPFQPDGVQQNQWAKKGKGVQVAVDMVPPNLGEPLEEVQL